MAAYSPAAGFALPAGLPPGAVALAVVAVLAWWWWRRPAPVVVLVVALAVTFELVPDFGGRTGGPLEPGAPVPAAYRPWVERAGSLCADITPALLAAQLRQESGFNPRARSPVGAMGVAQFMPGTWATWATDADGGGADVWNPPDAIVSQGRLMCALASQARDGLGAGRLRGDVVSLALAGYNAGFGRVQAAGGVPAITETRNYIKSITVATAAYAAGPTLPHLSIGEPS